MAIGRDVAQRAAAIQAPPTHTLPLAGRVSAEITEVAAALERNEALHSASAQALADEHAVNLGGTEQDAVHARVRPNGRDRRRVRIAHAAVQLQAPVRNPEFEFREPHLRHRRINARQGAVLELAECLIQERARHGKIGLDLGEAELGILKVENPLTESFAILDEFQRERERKLGGRQIARAFGDPHVVQHAHRLLEPTAFAVAEQPLAADAGIIEKEFRLVRAAPMQRLDRLAAGYAPGVDVNQENAHALRAAFRVGLAYHGHHRAEVAVRDPDLAAVDHIVVALALREGAEAGDITAGLRLGEARLRDGFAARVSGQPLALLLLGAAGQDEIARAVDSEAASHARAGERITHLFVKDDMVQEIAPAPAILRRHSCLEDPSG